MSDLDGRTTGKHPGTAIDLKYISMEYIDQMKSLNDLDYQVIFAKQTFT